VRASLGVRHPATSPPTILNQMTGHHGWQGTGTDSAVLKQLIRPPHLCVSPPNLAAIVPRRACGPLTYPTTFSLGRGAGAVPVGELASQPPATRRHMDPYNLYNDCLTLALRLYGEDPDTLSPEAAEVMSRWRPRCERYMQEECDGIPTVRLSV